MSIFIESLKMKILVKLSVAYLALAFSVNSWAYTLGGTDVGDVDNILYTTSLGNSSDADELVWINSMLNPDSAIFSFKFDIDENLPSPWTLVDGGHVDTDPVYAFELTTDPEYYLVKLGGGNFSGDTHVLYDNASSLSYAVVDLLALGQGAIIDITRISHISEFNGTSVPEPGTLAIFGLGLLGLMLAARRQA